jgi:hypothetical protein
MAYCSAAGCGNQPTLQWQRWATEAELEWLRSVGEIGPEDTECLLPIRGCDEHKITDDLAAVIHDASCAAPPTCDCSASDG